MPHIKDMAGIMARHGLRKSTRPRLRKAREPRKELLPSPPSKPPIKSAPPPDSWAPVLQVEAVVVDPPRPRGRPPEQKKGPTPNEKKSRRKSMSLSASEEEATILRRAAAQAGMGFSEWARTVLFAAAGKEIPSRPHK